MYEITESVIYQDEHSRWDEEHRLVCEDCYSAWVDDCMDMEADARLDALAEQADE